MLFSFAKSSAIPRFALFLIVSATFPLAILGLEENSELLEVEKERHSFGRHRHEEGDAENGHKGLALDFPEQLTISIGGSGKIQFKYSGILDAELRLSFSYNGTILKVEPPEILLPRGENSTTELTVTGLALSSRTFIDLANCTFGNGTQKCPFEKEEVFVRVVVVKSRLISVLVIISGWIYFLAWSISFYPQIILNCQRKSVVGLNFDFLVLNIIGFACYTIYNVLLYFDENVQDIYIARHGHRSLIPVLLNDVVFASHALLACIITGFQCFIYERGNQRISYTCRAWASVLLCFCFLSLFLTLLHVLNWLDFINYLAYGKMAVTLSKYFPQAILNFRRKSTVGWSIGNVLLDFFGGSMDICQMILQATNTNDWSAFTGNPVKFGLGFVSIIFDILFMIQHYILYPHKVYTELSTYDQVSDEREPPLSPPTRTITLQNNQRNDETEPVVFP